MRRAGRNPLPFDILHEDANFIVIDKPAGLLATHTRLHGRAAREEQPTAEEFLAEIDAEIAAILATPEGEGSEAPSDLPAEEPIEEPAEEPTAPTETPPAAPTEFAPSSGNNMKFFKKI